jgi:hypothetical protein
MLTPGPIVSWEERELIQVFRKLKPEDRDNLKAFAEFLHKRAEQRQPLLEETETTEPLDIPRPGDETVVGAIKRLSKTFFMLDRSKMLHETSSLMTDHLIQGRDAVEVIDELEQMFQRHFKDYRGQGEQS